MDYDAIIIGLGAMGTSAAFHLARRGVRVLGLEQFGIPHGRGSSHGYSRMTRMAYHEHPDYVPLLRRANELWQELEHLSGERLLHLTGGLYVGPPEGELVAGALQSARRHQLVHDQWDRAELARRLPVFRVPDHFVAVHEPNAGYLLCDKVVGVQADLAMRSGGELHGHEPVLRWERLGDQFAVHTARGSYHAARLIFCGGAWSGKLLTGLGVPLKVTRQVLGWVWPRRPELFEYGRLPVWAIDRLDGSIHYGFPMVREVPGFKLAHHSPGRPTDPDHVSREILAGDEETFREPLRRYLPDADGPLLSIRTCLYTHSPDGHFIVDRYPTDDRVLIACGFSGHGFKFAGVIGEALADLATTGITPLPIAFLGLHRFA